jgi:hypothetical protein
VIYEVPGGTLNLSSTKLPKTMVSMGILLYIVNLVFSHECTNISSSREVSLSFVPNLTSSNYPL